MGKIEVINHPLIQHKLSILRRTDTSTKAFRELVDEIAMLMGYEVLRDLPLEDVEIETPITKTVQKQLVCLVSAPEGVKALQEAHPDVEIFTAALDERLNEHGYIVPGLGDAGDRLFGTK